MAKRAVMEEKIARENCMTALEGRENALVLIAGNGVWFGLVREVA